MKPDNILIDPAKKRLQITDLGLSRDSPVLRHLPLTPVAVALAYRPPELFMGCQNYSQSIDVWSCGVSAYQMRYGRVPFAGKQEIEMMWFIFSALGTPTEKSWPGCADLKYFQADILVSLPMVCPVPAARPCCRTTRLPSFRSVVRVGVVVGWCCRVVYPTINFSSEARKSAETWRHGTGPIV